MAKANDTSKEPKKRRSSWAIGGAALSGAGALGATAYGLRRGHKRRLDHYQSQRDIRNQIRDMESRASALRSEIALQRMANPE